MALWGAACASLKPTPTPVPPATPTPTPTATPATPTWGQSAELGRTVYTDRCAKCHGEQGQGLVGPALLGPTATLEKFNTAQGLMDFISLAMPMDAPGSLSKEGYQQVLAFLVVQNNLVPTRDALDPARFRDTPLIKSP